MTTQPVEWFRTHNSNLLHVTSETREQGIYYTVDLRYGGCGCPGYREYSHCKHNTRAQQFSAAEVAALPLSPFVRVPVAVGL